MAILINGMSRYLSRASAWTITSDWTMAGWRYFPTDTNGAGTVWLKGDSAFVNPYVALFDNDQPGGTWVETWDGTTDTQTTKGHFARNSWVYLVVRYNSSTHAITLSSGTLTSAVVNGNVGTITVNLSTFTFVGTNEYLSGDTAGSFTSHMATAQVRTWQANLTDPQINAERLSSLPILPTNLIADTPVSFALNLYDTTATGAAWTLTGSSTAMNSPLPQMLQAKLVSFAKIANTGTQNVTGVTDINGNTFRPLLMIPFSSDQTGTGFTNAGNPNTPCGSFMWGWSDGNATQMCACGGYVDGNNFSGGVYPVNVVGVSDQLCLLRLQNATINQSQSRGTVSATARGQFTVNWTQQDGFSTGAGYLFHMLCLGGPDIFWAMVEAARPGAIGAQSITSGITFTPTAILATYLFNFGTTSISGASGASIPTIGWAANPLGGQGSSTREALAFSYPQLSASEQTTTYYISRLEPQSVTAIGDLASLTSFDSTPPGFHNCWASLGTGSGGWAYLVLGNIGVTVLPFTQPAIAGPQTINLMNTPSAVLLMSTGQNVQGTIQPNASISFGAADGLSVMSNWAQAINNSGPTVAARYHSNTDALTLGTANSGGGTVNAQITGVSFGAMSTTLTWGTVDSTARQGLLLALGGASSPVPVGSCPLAPTVATTYPVVRERTWMFPWSETNRNQFIRRLEFIIQAGIGLPSGQGSNPIMMFRFSPDGGVTWQPEIDISAGKQGAYNLRAYLSRNFYGRNPVGKLRVSDPVNWQLLQLLADMEEGSS